jgi:hypothetical protein
MNQNGFNGIITGGGFREISPEYEFTGFNVYLNDGVDAKDFIRKVEAAEGNILKNKYHGYERYAEINNGRHERYFHSSCDGNFSRDSIRSHTGALYGYQNRNYTQETRVRHTKSVGVHDVSAYESDFADYGSTCRYALNLGGCFTACGNKNANINV